MLKYVQIHIYTVIYFTVGGIRPSMTDQLSGLIYKILRSFFVACEPYESYKFDRLYNRIAKRSIQNELSRWRMNHWHPVVKGRTNRY